MESVDTRPGAGDRLPLGDLAARRFSRRQLLRRSAIALGGMTGLGLLDPTALFASSVAAPRPIPGGFDENFNLVASDPLIHVLPPGIGFEMSTITDFNGVIGGSETRGTAQDTDGNQYSFDCDMRFMRGVYVGLDGRLHNGSFGFIWIDLFTPVGVFDPGHQVHDFEPGIAPSGLFWTIPIAPGAIDVDPGRGRARLHAANVPVGDYGNFFNAITPGFTPIPSHVSFDVRWPGGGDRQKISDETFGFTGHYVTSATTISFTASNDGVGVIYRSDPGGQLNPGTDVGGAGPPAVGHERNGSFFH